MTGPSSHPAGAKTRPKSVDTDRALLRTRLAFGGASVPQSFLLSPFFRGRSSTPSPSTVARGEGEVGEVGAEKEIEPSPESMEE